MVEEYIHKIIGEHSRSDKQSLVVVPSAIGSVWERIKEGKSKNRDCTDGVSALEPGVRSVFLCSLL